MVETLFKTKETKDFFIQVTIETASSELPRITAIKRNVPYMAKQYWNEKCRKRCNVEHSEICFIKFFY